MRKDITIDAEPRETRGKNEARRLRVRRLRAGVLYGRGRLRRGHGGESEGNRQDSAEQTGHNTIFNLAVKGGETTPVMIIDWQSDPVKDNLLHIDLKRIDLTKRIRVKVPVHTKGEPNGREAPGRSARSHHA